MKTVSRRGLPLAAAVGIRLAVLLMLPLGAFAADGAIVINSRYGDEPAENVLPELLYLFAAKNGR